MGFAVVTIRKPKGNDAGTSAHIERKVDPCNADKERTHLNEQLVEYPDGVENRTQAIQHRIETAGITRKISHNQVRVLQVLLTGTPEDMQRIESESRLGEWCEDNLDWLRKTFGAENVVSAELHRDEKTPHIHAAVVPIVSGERRKVAEKSAKPADPGAPGKRTYRKKPANTVRLCADDVMTRKNLERFQDTYAEAMAKYGLERGIRGSDARHITTTQFYRDLHVKNEDLREDIANLEEEKQEVKADIRYLYDQKDEAQGKFYAMEDYRKKREKEVAEFEEQAKIRTEQAAAEKQQAETELAGKQSELQKVKGELKAEKFKSSAAEAGTKLMDGVGSLFGSSKIERQQQEIDSLKAENAGQRQEITHLNQTIARERGEHQKTTDGLNAELGKIYEWLPDTKPLIRIGEYCREVGFTADMVKQLLAMQPVRFSGKLYSHEFSRRFETADSEARLERNPKRPGMFELLINKIPIIQWFRQKYDDIRKAMGIPTPKNDLNQSRGKGIGR